MQTKANQGQEAQVVNKVYCQDCKHLGGDLDEIVCTKLDTKRIWIPDSAIEPGHYFEYACQSDPYVKNTSNNCPDFEAGPNGIYFEREEELPLPSKSHKIRRKICKICSNVTE